MSKVLEGTLNSTGMKFALVVSRFNDFINARLQEGAIDCLVRHGTSADDITVIKVPGAFEIPLACKRLAANGRYDAIIALGAVIRGSTPHFDYVASEVSKGIANVMLQADVPVTFGVLTTDTIEQAIERAGTKMGNKGAEAAISAIEIVDVLRKVDADVGKA